ncbi:MAG: hypothetical protein ACE5Z5_01255 [Candidatus Bathyarchaeia archaeon]
MRRLIGEDFKKLRNGNIVKFARIKKPIDITRLVELCQTIDKDFEDDNLRMVLVEQNHLLPEDKWGRYIRAPSVYYKILGNSSVTRFSDIVDLRRGYTEVSA